MLAYGDAQFVISHADWERIERASYKRRLSDAVREDVRRATEELLYWEGCTKLSVPVGNIRKEIRGWKNAAEKLERKGLANHTAESRIAKRLIEKEIGSPTAVTAPLIVACEKVLGDLERTRSIRGAFGDYDTAFSFKNGEAWNLWVKRLIQLLASEGLPVGERANFDEKDSPFVAFVRKLQEYLPAENRRSVDSKSTDSALVKAIQRAKRDK